jgi:hypothetical protein
MCLVRRTLTDHLIDLVKTGDDFASIPLPADTTTGDFGYCGRDYLPVSWQDWLPRKGRSGTGDE